jgi:ribosome recycling factor
MLAKGAIKEIEEKMKKCIESARREFSEVRTGRAHPGLIEGLHVDYFGTPTLLKQMASISIADAKTILVQPWDASVIPEIEKAVAKSSLGVQAVSDGKVVRIIVPPLSEERRNEMKKVVKDMAEKTRVSLRTIRREANERLKKMESDKQISEDENFRGQEEVQKMTDRFIKDVDALLEEKTAALNQV